MLLELVTAHKIVEIGRKIAGWNAFQDKRKGLLVFLGYWDAYSLVVEASTYHESHHHGLEVGEKTGYVVESAIPSTDHIDLEMWVEMGIGCAELDPGFDYSSEVDHILEAEHAVDCRNLGSVGQNQELGHSGHIDCVVGFHRLARKPDVVGHHNLLDLTDFGRTVVGVEFGQKVYMKSVVQSQYNRHYPNDRSSNSHSCFGSGTLLEN